MSSQSDCIVVLGSGTMAADICALFAAHGHAVHVIARPGKNFDTLPQRIARSVSQLGTEKTALKIHQTSDLATVPWRDAVLVVECVKEDLALKQDFFAQLEKHAATHTVLASNSSSFPISRIGQGLATQSRMLGLHFFMPAHLIPLVEVVQSDRTDPAIARGVYNRMESLGCKPVLVKRDVLGFLANRLQHALMREAWSLIDRGVASPEDVDKAVRYGFGFRYVAAGPVLQKELSGLDVNCAVAEIIYPDLCNDTRPPPVLREKVARGEHGIKTGKGFWDWTTDRIAAERARYDRALKRAVAILKDETN